MKNNQIKQYIINTWNHKGFQKYFRNTSWMFIGQLSMIISFLINIWLARYFGPEKFGVINYVFAFVGIFSFIANFGFMGAIYFLSLPGIMLLASFLPVGSRKQIVFFSVELIKNTVNLILTWMVSSKKSKYKNIQHSSTSFFQSGNKLL